MTSQDTAQPRYFVVVTTKTFRSLAEARERARPGIGDPCRIRIPSYVVLGRGCTKPASILRTSMVPVPVVTTGSAAANACSSSLSSASMTPRPHGPLPSSTGPKTTI
jgi:hypothetical protein